jgi:hypothetical protein
MWCSQTTVCVHCPSATVHSRSFCFRSLCTRMQLLLCLIAALTVHCCDIYSYFSTHTILHTHLYTHIYIYIYIHVHTVYTYRYIKAAAAALQLAQPAGLLIAVGDAHTFRDVGELHSALTTAAAASNKLVTVVKSHNSSSSRSSSSSGSGSSSSSSNNSSISSTSSNKSSTKTVKVCTNESTSEPHWVLVLCSDAPLDAAISSSSNNSSAVTIDTATSDDQ